MLHALNQNYEAVQELRDRGYGEANFKVAKTKVMFTTPMNRAKIYQEKEVYYREDTEEPIAIHGLRYNPVQYPTMIDKTRDMIERCNLNAEGIQERIQVSPNGGMCLVEYNFPAAEYQTPDGDSGHIKVMALSSFNGVWSFILSLGFQQGACLNSQIFIRNPAAIYRARHTNKLNIDKGVHVLGQTANIIEDEISLWHDWYNQSVTRPEVFKIFMECSNFQGSLQELMDIYNEKGKTNNKTFDYLLNVYDKEYQPAMSSCFWAVYNAITAWATHAPSSAKNQIALSQRRSDKASEVIDRYLLAA